MSKQRNRRRNNNRRRSNREPFSLTDPLTPKTLKKEVRSATRLEFKPLQREISAERRASDVARRRIKDYFPQYDQAIQQAQGQTTAAYDAAKAELAGQTGAASNYSEALRARLSQEASADNATRGAIGTNQTDHLAAADMARVNAANVLAGVMSAQGASQSSYLTDKRVIGGRERIEQLRREDDRSRSYDADKRELARRKGDFASTLRGQLRGEERDYSLGLKAARLDKKGQKIQTKLPKMYRRNDRLAADRSYDHQLGVIAANAAAKKAADKRAKKNWGNQNGGKPDEDSSKRAIGPGKIRSYIAQNATPGEVATDPQVAIRRVLSRWSYLSRSYVERIVNDYMVPNNSAEAETYLWGKGK